MFARPVSFLAAPVCLFVYGVCYLLDGRQGFHGPGMYWTVGHMFFILAFIAFAFAAWDLKRRAPDGAKRHFATVAALLAMLGIAVFVRVGGIDLATGLLAPDHDGMAAISGRLNAWPDARLLPWWRLGPLLFEVGLMSLLILLVFVRRLPWWSPLAVLSGFLAIAYRLNFLIVGAMLIGAGFFPLFQKKSAREL